MVSGLVTKGCTMLYEIHWPSAMYRDERQWNYCSFYSLKFYERVERQHGSLDIFTLSKLCTFQVFYYYVQLVEGVTYYKGELRSIAMSCKDGARKGQAQWQMKLERDIKGTKRISTATLVVKSWTRKMWALCWLA